MLPTYFSSQTPAGKNPFLQAITRDCCVRAFALFHVDDSTIQSRGSAPGPPQQCMMVRWFKATSALARWRVARRPQSSQSNASLVSLLHLAAKSRRTVVYWLPTSVSTYNLPHEVLTG
jgi:hypothetical protein